MHTSFDLESATPTRATFQFPPIPIVQPQEHPKIYPVPVLFKRSLSIGSTTLAMSMQSPVPTRHARRPSLSEVMLRDIVQKDDIKRGRSPSPPPPQSSNRHKRRHSTNSSTRRPQQPTPHSQVLQARLERVLNQTPPNSPVFSHHPVWSAPSSSSLFSSNRERFGHPRRSIEDDKPSDSPLEERLAPWNQSRRTKPFVLGSPSSSRFRPQQQQQPQTPTKGNGALLTPPPTPPPDIEEEEEDEDDDHPNYQYHRRHPQQQQRHLRRTTNAALPSPTTSSSSTSSSSISSPLSPTTTTSPNTKKSPGQGGYFNPRVASLQAKNIEGYVSFGEVVGLDCDGLVESERLDLDPDDDDNSNENGDVGNTRKGKGWKWFGKW